MVNPGGNSTMLGQWRIIVRQAEELARAGRFGEALALLDRPEARDHRQAVQMRSALALDLLARASRRGQADDLSGALDDLELAERFGAPPDALAAARLSLADRVAGEVRTDLELGEPGRVIERVESLARRKVSGPALRRAKEAADAWQAALAEAHRGEFGRATDQLDRAERLAGEAAKKAIDTTRNDLESRQKQAFPKVEQLYAALSDGKPAEVLSAAEAVLALVPEHPAARQARARAWQQIAAVSPSTSLPHRNGRVAWSAPASDSETMMVIGDETTPPPAPHRVEMPVAPRIPFVPPAPAPAPVRGPAFRSTNPGPSGRFLLWADSIGGYLVCLDDEVILGRAGPDSPADVPLLGDVSRHHATIIRNGDGYIVRAVQPTYVNGVKVDGATLLRHGDVIRLGSTVELEFRQPSPVSSTASLEILSRHRLPLAVEGILLMAETCIIGPSSQAHISAPALNDPVVLYRQGPALWCRAAGPFEVDGRPCLARAQLTLQSSVLGEGFSFTMEPLGSRSSQV